jgi:ribosomal-protein-alanine N-acetyltransferase
VTGAPVTEGFSLAIEPMLVSDIDAVMRIETEVFPIPWSPRAYRYDLGMDKHSHYHVIRGWSDEMPAVVAYAGFWLWGDEAHVGTIAVHPEWQRKGLGQWVLLNITRKAMFLDAEAITLEVRVSNLAARRLYRKMGFQMVGRRRRYYRDTGEDAYIMTLAGLHSGKLQARLDRRLSHAELRLQAEFGSNQCRHDQQEEGLSE